MANVGIDLAVNLREVKFYILRAFIIRNFKSNARLNGVKCRSYDVLNYTLLISNTFLYNIKPG